MVSDMDKATIINLHSKGLSKRKIANTPGIARNTVKCYIREHEEAKARIEAAEDPVEKARIQKSALEAPRMDTSGRKPRVFGGGLERRFSELCEADGRREGALGPSAKQGLNSAVLHRQLLSEGFEVSGRTIRSKFAERKGKGREVFIRQSYECGERADFDFHQAKVTIAGSPRVAHQATISRPASNRVFAAPCDDETMASAEKALIAFFEECGVVFGEVAFDSLKPVVARIGRRRAEKAYTDETTRFAAYYGFSINACNPARGNEEGHVGNSGKNARAELFSTVCEFAAWEGMEAHRDRVMAGCNRRSAAGFAKERPALRPPPGSRYVVARFGEAKANKYSLISVMSNFCSAPEGLAGERVEWRP